MPVRFPKHLEAPVIKEPEMASLTNMERPINKTIYLLGLENPQTVQFIIKSKVIFSGYKYAGNISIHSYIQKKILDKDQTSIPTAVGYW
jgi:hypothetical protein